MDENLKTYKNILDERKRTLIKKYLEKDQDDLEKMLAVLYNHF